LVGKLDGLRHTDRTFILILESGAQVRGVVVGDSADLSALGSLWGRNVVVAGVARFRRDGAILRIEAGRIERAEARDLTLWGAEPRPILDVRDERALRQPQSARSGVNAIFGRLADVETDDEIIEALDRLS
jgi:hypothetical protein